MLPSLTIFEYEFNGDFQNARDRQEVGWEHFDGSRKVMLVEGIWTRKR